MITEAPSGVIPAGQDGSPVDWEAFRKQWRRGMTTEPAEQGQKLDPDELRRLGFTFASGDRNTPRVDLNQ